MHLEEPQFTARLDVLQFHESSGHGFRPCRIITRTERF